jgi:cytochrome c2
MLGTYRRPLLLLGTFHFIAAVSPASAEADPERGKALFEQCAACHSLEAGKSEVGPTLRGLFGRRTASEDFNYSPAMRRANITWTPELLDTYLADPQGGVFRGNRMPFSGIPDPQARRDLITYIERAAR